MIRVGRKKGKGEIEEETFLAARNRWKKGHSQQDGFKVKMKQRLKNVTNLGGERERWKYFADKFVSIYY